MMNMKATMNVSLRTAGATVLAPIAWGTTYVTVTELLPSGRPMFVAAMRVVPAGLVLLIVGTVTSRWRPRGAEWWRTAVLAGFNFAAFFPLLIVAVYRLPGGVAAAVGGLQPLLVSVMSWAVIRRRPSPRELAVGVGAALGVALVVMRPNAHVDMVGILAAVAANVSFSVGVVLTKRFPAPVHRLAATGWQLVLGGIVLLPLSLMVDGAPSSVSVRNLIGFTHLGLVGTALAFVLWFRGIERLPTAAPPLLGLAAPVTGAVLGWVVLGQSLSPVQLIGFVITIGAITYGAVLAPEPGGHRLRPGTEEIPAVAGHVDEDGKPTVRRLPGRRHELDACTDHAVVRRVEVVDAQEEPHAASDLIADGAHLPITVGPRQQNAGLGERWSDDDPALEATVVGC
jgi:probable blue pigment (indigoidine) exporter